jgi:hypothetical protein
MAAFLIRRRLAAVRGPAAPRMLTNPLTGRTLIGRRHKATAKPPGPRLARAWDIV